MWVNLQGGVFESASCLVEFLISKVDVATLKVEISGLEVEIFSPIVSLILINGKFLLFYLNNIQHLLFIAFLFYFLFLFALLK